MSKTTNGIPQLQTGRKYAELFMARMLWWSTAKPKPTIEARMHVGVVVRVVVFRFTLGRNGPFTQTLDQGLVSKLIARAKEIAPTCEPTEGDLAVFDGREILMFRRFDERLTKKSAHAAAAECACHILMQQAKRKRQETSHEAK